PALGGRRDPQADGRAGQRHHVRSQARRVGRRSDLRGAGRGAADAPAPVRRIGAAGVAGHRRGFHGRAAERDRDRGQTLGLTGEVVDDPGGGRAVRVVAAFSDGRGAKARLVMVASLGEAERLVAAERKALLQVAVGASLFLIVAFWILLGRILIRRVSALQLTMRAVEGGHLDVRWPGPAAGGGELAYLARGFNQMLARIRGFNAELTHRIEEATAELTRKNRDLEELNELLVAARRDLTSKERLAALGQLAGTIAHELGNPLNAISGHLQLLARRPDLAEPAKPHVPIVH